jgi:hypothetical protein
VIAIDALLAMYIVQRRPIHGSSGKYRKRGAQGLPLSLQREASTALIDAEVCPFLSFSFRLAAPD